jgi:hypothetical protein
MGPVAYGSYGLWVLWPMGPMAFVSYGSYGLWVLNPICSVYAYGSLIRLVQFTYMGP